MDREGSSWGPEHHKLYELHNNDGVEQWASYFVQHLREKHKNSQVITSPNLAFISIETFQDVPIAFFCHGIGGLVLKQALLYLYRDDESYVDLTMFIVFIATPHHGSEAFSDPNILYADQSLKGTPRLRLGSRIRDQLRSSD